MSDSPQTWKLERHAPVRADAEAIFVSSEDLPDAKIGDIVVATGHDGGEQRTGMIVEVVDRDGQPFLRLEFDG